MTIEYRVRPTSKFVVTRYEQTDNGASCGPVGHFDSHRNALDAAHALAKYEEGAFCHENLLSDVPALLRNIAEEASLMIPTKRGLVFLELENGSMVAFGLGETIGCVEELAQKGVDEINSLSSIGEAVVGGDAS